MRDGCVVQDGLGQNQRLTFGDTAWRDYEFTLEARKTGGSEGFLILFRVLDDKRFYWCNLGGWGNQVHQLERGDKAGQRWQPVGPRAAGGIDQGRWYRIRVRCEGPRIRVWLDDEALIDFTDPDGHPAGKVGVGTWSTQAEFRGLRVASLDGTVLHEGLPQELLAAGAARHWESFGSGQVFIDRDNPLNSLVCHKLVGRGGETGLRQKPIRLVRSQTYVGSLWLRGAAAGGAVVRLTDGRRTLAEQTLPPPANAWAEYPIRLNPAADAPDGAIEVALKGQGEVWIDQVSLMPLDWRKAGGFRPDLLAAIAALRPPVIRWPGGCFASAYRWKDGIGPQAKRGVYPRPLWDDLDVNSFGTDEFVALCRKVGAEPLIVVNIGTPQWVGKGREAEFEQDILDWIEYCNGPADSKWGKARAANGHPEPYGVKYWEIDNETWGMGAEAYANAVCKIAPLMKKADPSIKLAACGSAGYGRGGIGLEWNRILIERCADLVDYLSIHHYEDPNLFADGPRRYEQFFRDTADLIARSKNPNLKIYVSEWNAQSTDWRTGLYCGGLLNAFERCGDALEIGGPALFLRHTSAREWDNAFINFNHTGWFPAPNYVVMKLWRDHYAPERIAMEGDAGPLNAVATKSADGKTIYVKAVNPTHEAVSVTLEVGGDFRPGKPAVEVVAPGALQARNTLEQPDAVKPVPGRATLDGTAVRLELPPLSAAVVTFPVRK